MVLMEVQSVGNFGNISYFRIDSIHGIGCVSICLCH